MKKNKPMKRKIKGITYWKKKAWEVISLWVRTNGGTVEYNYCFTCGIRKHYKELHCGHYIHGRLDYELNNLKPQCPRCNKWLRGNLAIYAERLIKLIGAKVVEKMRLYSFKKGNNYTITECKEVIAKYRIKEG